jgi:cytochrome P450
MSAFAVNTDLLPFADAVYQEDPYPYYRVVRDLTPLYESPVGVFAVVRHHDVASLLRDKRLSAAQLDFGVANIFHDSVLGMDSPDHGRLRRISAKWFTAERTSDWIVETRRIVDKALDEGAIAGGLDACEDLSFAATFGTMAYILGVGTHDAAECRQKVIEMGRALRPAATDEDVAGAQAAFAWYVDYIRDLVEFKRRHPGSSLLDAFLAAQEAGDMSEAEIMATVTLFYAVGHLDNSFLIQNGIRLLAEMPDERELFRSQPEIRNDMISEMLRVDTPEQFVTRVALEDMDISGETLPAGAIVLGMIGSANMDERVFPDPETFDHARADLTRLQMAFGAGQHGCHGQLLARAQADCALGALVERFPEYRVSGPVTHRHTEFIRNISTLPIEFH